MTNVEQRLTYVHIRWQGSHNLSAALPDCIEVLAGHENAVLSLGQNHRHIVHSSASRGQADVALCIQKRAQAVAVVPVRALVLLVHAVFADILWQFD